MYDDVYPTAVERTEQQQKSFAMNKICGKITNCCVCVCVYVCSFLKGEGLLLVNAVILLAVADASNISIFTANIQKS